MGQNSSLGDARSPTTTDHRTTRDTVEYQPLAGLRPHPLNPRDPMRAVDPTSLAELTASICAVGVLQPLLITPDRLIVAGHRRAAAAAAAGLIEVPVIVRALTEVEQLAAMLAENLQRQALDPVETASACRALLDRGMAWRSVCDTTGMSAASIRAHVAIFALPTELHAYVAGYRLPLSAVPQLLRLPAPQQLALGLRAAQEGWPVREIERVVDVALAPAAPERQAPRAERPAGSAAHRRGTSPADTRAAPTGRSVIGTTRARPKQEPARGGRSTGIIIDLLCELVTQVQRTPATVRDPIVRDWLERLAAAVKNALAAR
jgi:ParB family chromosome partitioning protein